MKLRLAMVWSIAIMKPTRTRGWSGQTQCGKPEVPPPSEKKKKEEKEEG
jgi:hypothetical protein